MKVPKGTSEYQAAWILNDEQENGDEEEDESCDDDDDDAEDMMDDGDEIDSQVRMERHKNEARIVFHRGMLEGGTDQLTRCGLLF